MDIKATHVNFLSVTSVAVIAHKAFEAFIDQQPEPDEEIHLSLPASMCHNAGIGLIPFAAFSVELGLKTLLSDYKIESGRTHDLRELFNKLPANVREEIRFFVCRSCEITIDEFEEKLSDERLAFVNWRYWHETSAEVAVDPGFLLSLSQAIVAQFHAFRGA
jgi:hypothetical protein